MPKRGLLSIFAELSGWPAYAFLFEEGEPLVRRPRPPEVMAAIGAGPFPYRAAGVVIEPQLHLPETVSWSETGPLSPREVADCYDDLRRIYEAELFPESNPVVGGRCLVPGSPAVHQMLGLVPSDAGYADVPDPGPIDPAEVVLLAFDSDCLVGTEFGDAQRVWLLVDRDRLAAGDVSRLRCALG